MCKRTIFNGFSGVLLILSPGFVFANGSPEMIEIDAKGLASQVKSYPYFIEVETSDPSGKEEKELCTAAHTLLTSAHKQPIQTECSRRSDYSIRTQAEKSGKFPYAIRLTRTVDHALVLHIDNWSRKDETEMTQLEWKIAPGLKSEQSESLQKLFNHFVGISQNQRFIKEYALVTGLKESNTVGLDESGRYYNKGNLEILSFPDAYRLYQDEKPRQKHYLRATIEIVALIGVGTAWYWKDHAFNEPDWDLGWNWASWRKKLITGEGVSFDTNHFETNALMHPMSGLFYYWAARTNNFNSLESFLMATAASTLWEYCIEFREKVSINDMIMTPVSGTALGEVFSQLGSFFDRSADNLPNKILARVFGGPRKFHDWLDGNKPRTTKNLDKYGFTKDRFHEFEVFVEVGTHSVRGEGMSGERRIDKGVGVRTQIVNIPQYGREGSVSKLLVDGNFSELYWKMTQDSEGMSEFIVYVKAALAGYYKQKTVMGNDGNLQGYSFFIGAATAYEYSMRGRPGALNKHAIATEEMGPTLDKFSIANVLGPTIDFNYYNKGVRVHAVIDLFGDFAAVRSYAVEKYKNENPDAKMRGVLGWREYYYAFGVTASSKASIQFYDIELGAQVKADIFSSADGFDRSQEKITHDQKLYDGVLTEKAWIAYSPRVDWLKLVFTAEHRYRYGSMDDVQTDSDEYRYMGDVVFKF